MNLQHQLVPGHGSDNLVRLFSVGGLLTVEREQTAQENLQDSSNSSARLEGLIPALTDSQTYDNFMEVFHTIFLLFCVIWIYYYGDKALCTIRKTELK